MDLPQRQVAVLLDTEGRHPSAEIIANTQEHCDAALRPLVAAAIAALEAHHLWVKMEAVKAKGPS